MYCYKCGREISENDQTCPYCGEVQIQNIKEPKIDKSKEYNIFAMLSLICSLAFVVVGFHLLAGFGAIILAIIALVQINKEHSKGKGIAIAAIIIGAIQVICIIAFSMFFVNAFFDFFNDFGRISFGHYTPFFDGIYY